MTSKWMLAFLAAVLLLALVGVIWARTTQQGRMMQNQAMRD